MPCGMLLRLGWLLTFRRNHIYLLSDCMGKTIGNKKKEECRGHAIPLARSLPYFLPFFISYLHFLFPHDLS
jgi:hypothetical protein